MYKLIFTFLSLSICMQAFSQQVLVSKVQMLEKEYLIYDSKFYQNNFNGLGDLIVQANDIDEKSLSQIQNDYAVLEDRQKSSSRYKLLSMGMFATTVGLGFATLPGVNSTSNDKVKFVGIFSSGLVLSAIPGIISYRKKVKSRDILKLVNDFNNASQVKKIDFSMAPTFQISPHGGMIGAVFIF